MDPATSRRAIARTPTEIWAEILLMTLLMELQMAKAYNFGNAWRFVNDTAVDRQPQAPWKFLYICKRLKAVALAHSALWTCIRVPLHTAYPLSVKAVNRVLGWSRGRELALTLVTQSRALPLDILERVATEKERIASLTLFCRPYEDLLRITFARDLLRDWRCLTSLELNFHPSFRLFGVNVPRYLDLQMLPTLRNYKERGSSDVRTTVLLPLRTLETIRLHLPYEFISAQLGFAEKLTTLEIVVDNAHRYVDIDTFSITPNGAPLFPNVETAVLTNCPFVVPFLSGKRLVSLSYQSWFLRNTEIANLLREARNTLRYLYICGTHLWDDSVLRNMVWDLDHLEKFRVEINISVEQVWDFIEEEVAYSIWTQGVVELVNGLIVSACPALRDCEVTYCVDAPELQRMERLWLLREMRPFVHRIREPLGLLWVSRLLDVRVVWKVGDCSNTIEDEGLLWPGDD